jgi:DNA-binding XRE family transcriptional regulator
MTEKRSPIGESWNEYRETLLTSEERHEIDIKVEIITAILNARNIAGYSQKQLERLTGVKQPVISRMEKGETDPRLSTIMKILEPLGKTLVVVDKL